jgi:osmotically-inducible protein OsmY
MHYRWHLKSLTTALITCGLAWGLSGCIAPALILVGSGVVVGANTVGSNLPLKTQEEDSHIKMQAIASLKNYPELEGHSNVEITVYNGVVLLLGQVPTDSVKSRIAENIAKIEGVNVVYNEMTVGEPVTLGSYAEDTWLTTKVKTALGDAHLNSLHFKIVTENRVVYLLAVTTREDGDAAAVAASKVSGVQKVVKAYFFTHTDALPTTSTRD